MKLVLFRVSGRESRRSKGTCCVGQCNAPNPTAMFCTAQRRTEPGMIRAMKPVWLLLLALLSSNATLAQAPAKGMLLVATPELRDPRFSETVLLLLHYGPEGAIGVAINRPTWVEPTAAFPDMESLGRYRGNLKASSCWGRITPRR